MFRFPRVAREKTMECGKKDPAEHSWHEERIELSRKQKTITRRIPFREQAASLPLRVGANARSLLVIDEAERRISNQEALARAHLPVQLFEVQEVAFLHKAYSLEEVASY